MKRVILFLAVIAMGTGVYAQFMQQNPANAGHFDVVKHTTKGTEYINVNYSTSAAPFYNALKLNLNTPNPMMMSVKIVNSAGSTVQTWRPDQANYIYGHTFDISNLSTGNYKLDIYGPDNTVVHTISFEKKATTE